MNSIILIFSALLFLFDVYIIFWWGRFRTLKSKKNETMRTVSSLGHVIHINGKKGVGKTTSAAGLVMCLSEYLFNLMETRMNDIRVSLREINFNVVENKFDYYYNLLNDPGSSIEVILSDYNFETYYSDFLTIYDKKDMMNDYLIYYYVYKYRGIEVYSTGYLFNVITGKTSKYLDPTAMRIKDVIKVHNYQGGLFTIRFNDENNISNGNENSNNQKLRTNGYKAYLALKRHEGKATCYDISPGQVATDVFKQERGQVDVNLQIYDRNDSIKDFKLFRSILLKIKDVLFIPISIGLKIKAFFKRLEYDDLLDEFSKKVGKWRNFDYKIMQLCKLLKRQGLVRVRCKGYYNPDDVGKKDDSLYDKYIFYFPIWYVYGNINTYEYSSVLKEISSMNENSINEYISSFDTTKKFNMFIELMKKEEDKMKEVF